MSKINKIKVDNVIYDIEDGNVPNWARSENKPTYKTSELDNDSKFLTESEVDEKISKIEPSGSIEDIIYGNYDSEIIIGYLVENGVNIPVYRKIFKGEKVSGSNLVFDTTSLNIDKVLNVQGSTDRTSWIYPLMRYETSDNYTYAYYMPNDNKLIFTSGTSSWCSTGSVTIILEYIKKVN